MAEDTKRTSFEHIAYLAKDIFQVEERWPHYRLNLEDMMELSAQYRGGRVLSLERSILGQCGNATGESRWKPLFDSLTVVNHGMADTRFAYSIDAEIRKAGPWDLIMVPNLLHHVRDQEGFFLCLEELAQGAAEIYIFDAVIHELHDVPCDYIRYTPFGIRDKLERLGFAISSLKETGNHWAALWYMQDFAEHQYGKGECLKLSIRETSRMRALAAAGRQSEDLPGTEHGRRICMYWSVRARLQT